MEPVAGKKAIVRIVAIAVVLAIVLIAATLVAKVDAPRALRVVLAQLELKAENTVSVWISSALLAAVACACGIAFLMDRPAVTDAPSVGSTRVLRIGWLALTLIFSLLSFDEMGSIHERLGQLSIPDRIREGVGSFQATWVRQLVVPICLVAAFMLAFAWKRVRAVPAAFLCMALGVALFLLVPVQETIHAGWYFDALGDGRGQGYRTPPIFTVLEEVGELSGAILFLVGTLLFVSDRASRQRGTDVVALVPSTILAVVSFMFSGYVLTLALLGELSFLHDKQGGPQNWFPSMTTLLCATGCSIASKYAVRERYLVWGFRLLGLISILLSVDHATDHRLILFSLQRLADGVPFGRLLVPVCIAAVTTFVAVNCRSTPLRIGVCTWALLLAFGYSSGAVTRTTGALLAYCILLPALSAFLTAEARRNRSADYLVQSSLHA